MLIGALWVRAVLCRCVCVCAKCRFDGCAARAAALAHAASVGGARRDDAGVADLRGPALDVVPPRAAPRAIPLASLPAGAKLRAGAGGVAYYFTGTDQEGVVHALDLATGARAVAGRWASRV